MSVIKTKSAAGKPTKATAKPKTGKATTTTKKKVATTGAAKTSLKPGAVKKFSKPEVKKKSQVNSKVIPPIKSPGTLKTKLTPEERYRIVETAAYYIAERHGFKGGSDEHWAAAELEVAVILGQ